MYRRRAFNTRQCHLGDRSQPRRDRQSTPLRFEIMRGCVPPFRFRAPRASASSQRRSSIFIEARAAYEFQKLPQGVPVLESLPEKDTASQGRDVGGVRRRAELLVDPHVSVAGVNARESIRGRLATDIARPFSTPRPRNSWATGGVSAPVEQGSGGVFGRWSRRNVAPLRNRCGWRGRRSRGRRFGGAVPPPAFAEQGRSAGRG